MRGRGFEIESGEQQFLTCLKLQDGSQFHEFSSQLLNGVLMDGSPNGGPHLSFVNGVWVDKSMPLKPSFGDIVKKHYNIESPLVNFLNKVQHIFAIFLSSLM